MSDAGWAKRAAENLLPLSEEKRDLATAFKEWAYHQGDATDLGSDRADCELCDHPDIRYQFGIVNLLNGNSLLVGSECIQKFNIDVLDQEGRPLPAAAARKQLSSDRRKVIADRALQSVITSLLRLGQ